MVYDIPHWCIIIIKMELGVMENFLKRKVSSTNENPSNNIPRPISTPFVPKLIKLDNLSWDPIDRIRILDYHLNQKDENKKKILVKMTLQTTWA
ncbi:hypothetical protein R6Q57_029805 [Mikania cordata]